MRELDLVALTVPGVAALEEATRHAHYQRRGKAVRRAPSHRTAVVQLLCGGFRVLAELDLGDRHQARQRHADGAANDALLRQAGVEYSVDAVLLLQTQGGRVYPALAAPVFAKHQQARIHRELMIERAADRGEHVDAGTFESRLGRARRA